MWHVTLIGRWTLAQNVRSPAIKVGNYWCHVTCNMGHVTLGCVNFYQKHPNMSSGVFIVSFGALISHNKIQHHSLTSSWSKFANKFRMRIKIGNEPKNRISLKKTFLMMLVVSDLHYDHKKVPFQGYSIFGRISDCNPYCKFNLKFRPWRSWAIMLKFCLDTIKTLSQHVWIFLTKIDTP